MLKTEMRLGLLIGESLYSMTGIKMGGGSVPPKAVCRKIGPALWKNWINRFCENVSKGCFFLLIEPIFSLDAIILAPEPPVFKNSFVEFSQAHKL